MKTAATCKITSRLTTTRTAGLGRGDESAMVGGLVMAEANYRSILGVGKSLLPALRVNVTLGIKRIVIGQVIDHQQNEKSLLAEQVRREGFDSLI
jgi:hypothetical protein